MGRTLLLLFVAALGVPVCSRCDFEFCDQCSNTPCSTPRASVLRRSLKIHLSPTSAICVQASRAPFAESIHEMTPPGAEAALRCHVRARLKHATPTRAANEGTVTYTMYPATLLGGRQSGGQLRELLRCVTVAGGLLSQPGCHELGWAFTCTSEGQSVYVGRGRHYFSYRKLH